VHLTRRAGSVGDVPKHSNVRNVEVRLTRADGRICLSVSDDDTGFAGDAQQSRGLGLIKIRERVRQLHGTLGLESEPGRGTTVRAEVPFRPS
jgi:signal transduction histidine kinase